MHRPLHGTRLLDGGAGGDRSRLPNGLRIIAELVPLKSVADLRDRAAFHERRYPEQFVHQVVDKGADIPIGARRGVAPLLVADGIDPAVKFVERKGVHDEWIRKINLGAGLRLDAHGRSSLHADCPSTTADEPLPAAMRRFGPPTIRRTTVSPAPPGPIDDRWTYSGTPSLSRHHSLVVLVGGAESVCRPALGRWRRAQRAEHPARGPRCVLRCGGAARQTVTARQAGRGGGTRSARCRFDRELRSADIWRPLRHADQGGTVSLPACRLSLSPLPRLLRREQFDHGAAS